MTITPEQKQAIERAGEGPVELADPQTGDRYILLRAEAYRDLLELRQDEELREAVHRKAKRNAATRAQEP